MAIASSRLAAAGNGLYGIRPLPGKPTLFAQKGQFICTYATQKHQITAQTARHSISRYMWSTNTKNRQNPKALYFGKYINDHWNAHANNCELRWNPATGRVEIYALCDITLNEELGIAYGAPFWYQPHNGITTRT